QGESFILADFRTAASREQLQMVIQLFIRELAGTEAEMHPDLGVPVVLAGDEDPLPQLRANALPRYSYRDLEKSAEVIEDELKQVASVGRVRKIGNVG